MRLLAYAVFAVPAILLAIDMSFAFRFYEEPAHVTQVIGVETNQLGQQVDITRKEYTPDGRAQRRRDLGFSAVLFVGGVGAMSWAVFGLISPRSILSAGEDGISVAVDGPGKPNRLIPWDSVVEVKSGLIDVDGAPSAVLSIEFDDPEAVPVDPAGGISDPPWLHLFAEDWEPPAHQVAPFLDPRAHRRADG
jgi:hypothetical protein